MPASVNRRELLRNAAALGLIAAVRAAPRPAGAAENGRAALRGKVLSTSIITRQNDLYHGWPTLVRRKSGELIVVCSGGREAHVCPFGRVEMLRSRDDGRTWSWPQVILDGPLDDRDAGVLETAQGTLLVTTFTSLAYEPLLARAEQDGKWPAEQLARWQAARDRIPADRRRQDLGVWMIRSSDDGVTWSARERCLVNSPHGPVQLSDGRLLYAGKKLWDDGRIGVCESRDDGRTWHWLAEIPTRAGDRFEEYHELHAVEAADGRIIVHIRNHNAQNAREILQSESADGGKTWSAPRDIGVWGLPSHLLRLNDGRLLMTYGYRRQPFGNQARVSSDHGRTWSEPFAISADGAGGDLGYPSTVQLADRTLLTVWYERLADNPRAVLRQARWELLEPEVPAGNPAAGTAR